MKQTKPSSLARILGYAGGHKNLTVLGCILSALSAVLGLAPLPVCLAGGQKHTGRLAQPGRGRGSGPFWLDGGVVCHWQHPAVLRRPHVHPYRGLPHRPEHPARRHDPCAETPAGLFHRESVGAAAQAHRRQRRAHRGPAGPQAPRPGSHGSDAHRRHRRAVPL